MIFAQYFDYSVIDKTKLIESCGDRSVVIIDARLSMDNIESIAKQECIKRKYKAWQLFKGESFSRSIAINKINVL